MIGCVICRTVVLLMLPVLAAGRVAVADSTEFELADDLYAPDVLPAELLAGEHHAVSDLVRNDGYLNYYTLTSDYGEFEAVSTQMLRTRIGEINALAELDELSKTEVFLKAAADAGAGQLKTLQQFATRPVDTMTGIPKGIGRMFTRYKRDANEAVESAKEFVKDDDRADAGDDENSSTSTTDLAVGATEGFFGVSGAQRSWASKLGTDPYSSNEVLQAAIKEVAWADRLGRFGMGFAGVPEIPGADIIGEVNDVVWSKDPYELRDMNRARLAATGANEELIDAYLASPDMTPSQQTLLTAAIAEVASATGRDGILRQALNAESEAEVNFLIKSVTMLAWYHHNEQAIQDVLTYAAIPVGVTNEGTSVALFAIDHVYWTETIAAAASTHAEESELNEGAEIWLLGTASDRARKELVSLGFTVHEGIAEKMTAPAG